MIEVQSRGVRVIGIIFYEPYWYSPHQSISVAFPTSFSAIPDLAVYDSVKSEQEYSKTSERFYCVFSLVRDRGPGLNR